MIRNIGLNRALWLINGLLTLAAAVLGVVTPRIYTDIVSAEILPGVITQDITAVIAAVILLGLALTTKPGNYRRQIIALGILGFFIYAYGIYSIEQIYNNLYLVYLAIFGLSVYSFVYGMASIDLAAFQTLSVPPLLRCATAGYGFLIAIMFNFLWISRLIPLMRTGDRIEYLFSVFIIDLCFIMPGFVISGIMAIRNQPLGLVGLPALFILGVGILSPLALGEALRPLLFDLVFRSGEFWLYFILALVFLILAAVYLLNFRRKEMAEQVG